jgi:hypothetical protein
VDDLRSLLKSGLAIGLIAVPAVLNAQLAFRKTAPTAQTLIQSGLATLTTTHPANCSELYTFPITASGSGNTIILGMTAADEEGEAFWVTDNAGNMYTNIGPNYAYDNTNLHTTQIWSTGPTVPGATSISVCGYQFYPINKIWYMEVPGYWEVEDESSADDPAASATVIAPTVTATTAKDLIVSVGAANTTITGIKAGNNFTALTISGGYNMAYRFPGAAGAFGAQWNQTSSSTYCATSVAFKPGYTGYLSFIQQASADKGTSASSITAAFPRAQTAGNLNVVSIGWRSKTGTVSSISDSKGNTYQLAVGPTRGDPLTGYVYYAKSIAGASAGSNTVTVNFSGSVPSPQMGIHEYRADANVALDVATSGTTGDVSGSNWTINTNYPKNLVFNSIITTNYINGVDTKWGRDMMMGRQFSIINGDISSDKITSVPGQVNAGGYGGGGRNTVNNLIAFTDGTQAKAKLVQSTENSGSTTGTTVTLPAFASNTTTGNTVVCNIGYQKSGTSVTSVTDAAGNNYTKAIGYNAVKNAGFADEIWYKSNITGGAGMWVRATYGASVTGNWSQFSCFEFSNLLTAGALDKTWSGSGATAAVTLGPVTTTAAKELSIGYIMGCGAVSAGSALNVLSTLDSNIVESDSLNAITSGYTMSGTDGNGCWDGVMATFKSN